MICRQLKPTLSDAELVRIGRGTAAVVLVLSVLWSTQISNFANVFEAVNSSLACLTPPVSTCFLLGALWPRGTAQAAVVTLCVGFVMGMAIFAIDFRTQFVTNKLHVSRQQLQPVLIR